MKLSKNMTNLEIAELLRAVAAALQLKGADKNKFRIIAYERAADAIEHASSELKDLWDDGKLKEVPGIGEAIAAHLDELFRTGKSSHFEAIMKGLPPAMFGLLELPGVGAKTAFKLVKELKIKKATDLEKLAREGKIAEIEGFGEESQAEIIKSIEETKGKVKRHLLPYAEEIASEIIAWLNKLPEVKKADPLGSLRRKASTIGDIDISVATSQPRKVIDHFSRYPKAVRSIEKGVSTASILLPGGVQVDLMVQPQDSYGALLQHFTGSKHHNIALREYALKHGMSLSEYGIRKVKSQKAKIKSFSSEEEFYKELGMEWIPPELREDSGEIEAALQNKVPNLLELKDVKSDLQIHSSFDIETSHDLGASSMEEIINTAGELGYEYLAFTEHNPSRSKHSDKEIIDLLKRKREKVDQLNLELQKRSARPQRLSASDGGQVKRSVKTMDNQFTQYHNRVVKVFNSLEIDIMPDGKLPIPEEGLATLEFALISIHSSFRLPRGEMTKRILDSFAHPKVKILAHPTARKLNEREGIELNWPEIFEFCVKNDKWLEINADPMRLDLPDTLVHEAIKAGVKLTLGTDAHHQDNLNFMQFGVSVARRGWVTKADIINCLSLGEFEKILAL